MAGWSTQLLLAEATATEFGNLGVNSPIFQPIFQGALVIMAGGVVSAFVVALIIDKMDLYEQLATEMEGKNVLAKSEKEAEVKREQFKEAKKAAIIQDSAPVPTFSSMVDEYDD